MTEITLVIGGEARTADKNVSGYVKSLVVDRDKRTVTHLVVEPKGREGLARLVPVERVKAQEGKIQLDYTEEKFKQLDAAEELLAEFFDAGPVELVTEGWRPADDEPIAVDGSKISPVRATLTGEMDLVPRLLRTEPEEEEHRGDHVHATDGDIGQLRALCINSRTYEVTHIHVLLKEGHLWGHREAAIPSGMISGFAAGIHLNISKQQVQALAHKNVHPSG